MLLVTADAALHTRLLAVLTDALRFERGVATHSLLEACQHLDADLLVVDLVVADASNSLCWGYVRRRHPNARLAVLFDEHCDHALHLACAAGAIGYAPRHARERFSGGVWNTLPGGHT